MKTNVGNGILGGKKFYKKKKKVQDKIAFIVFSWGMLGLSSAPKTKSSFF